MFQFIKDKPQKTCPKCRGRVKRVLGTGAGIIFKGAGFYVTDYRKPGYTEAAKKDNSTATAASSSTKESTASKPQANNTSKE
jgi:predicted nucleic acid-binding Zn ribbon protein